MTAVPHKIVIGNVNPKLDVFHDGPNLLQAGGYKKINAIRVYYTDKYVRGFEIFYKLNEGDLLKACHNVPKKKKELQQTVFEIGPDDYLSEIQGALVQEGKKNKIANVTFLTYRGKAGTFGGKGNTPFGFTYPGHSFGAFSGGFKKQIEWLEIEVQPLPEEFKKDFQKINVNVIIEQKNGGQPQVQQIQANPVPYKGFAQVEMPKFGFGGGQQPQVQKAHSQDYKPNPFEPSNGETNSLPQNPIMSSKYPSLGNPPQPYSAQPQYPGGNTYQYPQYQYPGQMNGFQPPKQ